MNYGEKRQITQILRSLDTTYTKCEMCGKMYFQETVEKLFPKPNNNHHLYTDDPPYPMRCFPCRLSLLDREGREAIKFRARRLNILHALLNRN